MTPDTRTREPDIRPREKVLFLCTGNSARSQMAEALLRHLAGERFEVHSAGLEPKGVHPLTRAVLQELGIDTRALRSKHVKEYLGRAGILHHAIIVCAAASRSCPSLYPFARVVHQWPFEDPAAVVGTPEERRAAFRATRDAIAARLRRWLAE